MDDVGTRRLTPGRRSWLPADGGHHDADARAGTRGPAPDGMGIGNVAARSPLRSFDERTAWATGADTPIMLSTPSADTAFTGGGNPPTATTTEVAVIG